MSSVLVVEDDRELLEAVCTTLELAGLSAVGWNQRSTTYMDELVLLPANEIIMGNENIKRARSMGRLPTQTGEGGSFPGQEAWLNHFYAHPDTLFDYFPKDGLLIFFDPIGTARQIDSFIEKFKKDTDKYRRESAERNNPFPEIGGILLSREEVQQHIDPYQKIEVNGTVSVSHEPHRRFFIL